MSRDGIFWYKKYLAIDLLYSTYCDILGIGQKLQGINFILGIGPEA